MSASERPSTRPRDIARQVLEVEARAISGLIHQQGDSFDQAVALLAACQGRVVCTGMGKSGLVMKKIAATLSSTGSPAFFLHPAEAIHGDLGMVARGDVVLAASYSGATEELLRLTELLTRLDIPLVVMTGNGASALAAASDIHLPVAIDREACPLGLAPTASTTATLALGDALAMAISDARGFTADDFALLHPGGNLGRKLLRIEEVMHRGDKIPRVALGTPMPETIHEMSRKGFGITAITDADGQLLGCLSDGDLRRALETDAELMTKDARAVMRPGPLTIAASQLASAALERMEAHHITSLFVIDENSRLEGLVHLHDLWRLELF